MQQKDSTNLVLNVVPVMFSAESVEVGLLDYKDEDAYAALRQKHWQTHAFRFDTRTRNIINVGLNPDVRPLGEVKAVEIRHNLLLLAKAIQQSILIWLAQGVPIIKAGKGLMFWGQADAAHLLTQAVQRNKLETINGLEVTVRYEIDCRMFLDRNENQYLGLVMEVGASNIIDLSVAELLERGVSPLDKYVCRRSSETHPYLLPRLELLGRVVEQRDGNLFLTDTDGVTEIAATEALLEPRAEYLNEAIHAIYGDKSQAVLKQLNGFRQPLASALGKLDRIRTTLAGLKKRPIVIGNSVQVTLGDLHHEGQALFPTMITTERPAFLIGAQGRNTTKYPDKGISQFGPYLYTQHSRNTPLIAVVCEAAFRGRVEQFLKLLKDGFPPEEWIDTRRENPFASGLIGKFRLSGLRYEIEEVSETSATAYKVAIQRLLSRIPESPDLAIVQIRESAKLQRGNDNPYYVSKCAFMGAGVPTQAVHIERIEAPPGQLPYILNNIALAIYAKLDGTPWVISMRGPTAHELVVGLGSIEVSGGRLQSRTRYIGVTTVFQGDGRYIVWGLTREAVYEDYVTALLDSLKATISFVQQQGSWKPGDRVRLVFHVYKRLKDTEVEAIKELVSGLVDAKYTVEFAFLDMSESHPYYLFNPNQLGKDKWIGGFKRTIGKGVPERGICLQLDKSRGLLHLTGPGDVKTEQQGLPQPLLVELHRDSTFTDMTYLLRQIYHFSFMSWQSFFPASIPITIHYSRLIARLLGNLNLVANWDSKVVSVGALRGRKWFL